MKITRLFVFLFLMLCFAKITAQEFKLGKVSISELEQKVHPKDSSASAAILYKRGKARIDYDQNDGFITVMDVETRIKIYKKEGYDWANQEVWYYYGTNFREKVSISDAVTYNLTNGKIESTKLKSDGIFDEVINKYRSKKKMTMPNVKEGSVIEFKYTIKSPDVLIRDWDFQTSIPVNYSEFKTYVPEYFVFTPAQKGYVFPKVTSEKNNKSFIINSKERYNTGGFGGGATKTEFYQDKIEYMETQTIYIAEDFPAMKDEAYVNNIDNYTSSVGHELSMTKFPNKPIKQLSTDWNSVVKTIYDYEDFGPELNKTGYFEDDVKKLLEGTSTPEEKSGLFLTM